jgi:antitoxin CcdA
MSQKSACNTTINSDLLKTAKALNIKLSVVFESALEKEVTIRKQALWMKENKSAIELHNQEILKQGTFSESIGQLDD